MSNLPTTLGKYQIIREIARSNDIVYEAYDPLMNRRVALKELALPPGATAQQKEDRVRRFQREVKAAGSLAHPNIVTIYEVGEEAGRHFMAMEYLDGHTLRNELDTNGLLPADRALEIIEEVLGGLVYAHSNGVVHRDIKPENIQLLSDGRIKITDFGIARLTFEPNLTMDGQVFGTPSYMSPEQVIGKDIDARSDLFSCGVVLYEMLGGQKPFQGDSVVSITYAIMNKEPDPLPGVNHTVWQTLSRLIDKSPVLRFASSKEALEAVRVCRRTLKDPSPVLPSAPPPYSPAGVSPMPGYVYGQTTFPSAPPPSYTYDPYGTQNQSGMGPGGQPYVPLPIYFPPPPRQPLLKPATKQFLGRLCITLLLLGLLFVSFIAGIRAIGQAVGGKPGAPSAQPAGVDAGRLEPPPGATLADLVAAAESSDAAARIATSEQDQARNFILSGQQFEAARRATSDPDKVVELGDRAAVEYINASRVTAPTDPRTARDLLYRARALAAPGSEAYYAIEKDLQALSG